MSVDNNTFFNAHQIKSLNQVVKMIESNGAKVFDNLEEVAKFLNER